MARTHICLTQTEMHMCLLYRQNMQYNSDTAITHTHIIYMNRTFTYIIHTEHASSMWIKNMCHLHRHRIHLIYTDIDYVGVIYMDTEYLCH